MPKIVESKTNRYNFLLTNALSVIYTMMCNRNLDRSDEELDIRFRTTCLETVGMNKREFDNYLNEDTITKGKDKD